MNIETTNKALKTQLRKVIRRKRSCIDEIQRQQWDSVINRHLGQYAKDTGSSVLAAYLAFDGEPDLKPALRNLQKQGTTLALPMVHDAPGKAVITFRLWPLNGALKRNRYGILEPVDTEEIRVNDIDLMLVPLVAWDKSGGRLGMGASFYDRLLQPFAAQQKPLRVGVAYELQQVQKVPADPWDICLHSMMTENGLFTCAN